MSADGVRISFVASKGRELSKYMADILDADWGEMRGMEIQSVGISSISYDEESTKLINMRNQGAMLGDPTVREGYVQGSVARGIEAAGSNANGSMAGFMGVGMGMQSTTGFMGAASQSNQAQMEREATRTTAAQPVQGGWKCSCGNDNTGNFCSNCGKPKPTKLKCASCGYEPDPADPTPKFCPECGKPMQ